MLSTPLLIATNVASLSAASCASALTAAPSARARASEASSAACSLAGERPPSSPAICRGPIRAASRIPAPRTSVTAALAAAVAAPQPRAVNPASMTRCPSILREKVSSSQHDPPLVVIVWAPSGHVAEALGGGQVMLEGERVHRPI